jgi:hypothetical protein
MKTFLLPRTRRATRGSTYMTVVVTMIVVGVMLAAYIKMVGTQNTFATHSQTWNRSVAVLEAGIEEAMAHLNKNGSPDSGGTVSLAALSGEGWDNNGSTTGPWSKQGWLDGDFYHVTIGTWNGNTAAFPAISSTGYVRQLPAYAWRSSRGPFLAALYMPDLDRGKFTRRAVQCGLTNNPTFSRGLVAKHGIDMNGNNVLVDSYDSSNPAYSTNGRWVAAKRRDHGDIASNDTLTNIVNVGNANIWGRVATGPSGTVALGPNGKVGDAAWQNGSSSGVKPGWSSDDMNVEIPDVVLPAGSDNWTPPLSGTGGYQYVFNTPGDYRITWAVSGKILVSSPNVRLRVDGGWSFNGQDGMTITTNGSIKIYLNSASASITGQGIVNTAGTPNQCYIFGTTNLTSLDIGGNGECTAVVYAPNANVTLHGGGNSVQDFSGAIVANTFRFTGHYNVHYDEALGRSGLWRGFTIISWDER